MISKNKTVVLHVVEALGGGVYSYFTDLSHVLGQDSRIKLVIAYSNKRDEIDPEKVAQDFHANVELVLLDLKKEISLRSDFNGVKQISKLISQVNPDVIHLHSSKAGILGKIAIMVCKFKKPTYYTPHGYSFLRQDISTLKRRFYKNIEFLFARFSRTKTIACGDTEWGLAVKMNASAQLIRNGIRMDQFDSSKQHSNNNSLKLGTLGRISFQKDPTTFNEIALQSRQESFLWIGSGNLKHKITAPNIEVTGWFVDKNEAIPLLKQLDVYIQTSLWEGLPIAVIEAMAMGLPVIASNIIGNKDLVEHGKTGFLVDQNYDYVKFISMLRDLQTRKTMGAAGRKRVLELYDCNKNFKQLVDLYLHDLSSIEKQKY
ncbi:glycosyltransferase [Nonlabens marinus]|uniref:Exopolysaccharide biosynthesis glycosyltransferase EpsF n=1 Tax=Nonlabens marinus S1-08 TaxID=1454201 RepID=W8VZN0_9FLAO|nr:glycosyltransferase [Nonlabens marinus]BAO54861.1 exopolysaccharide biosynthesis glycosyltransferase EpsF [Nonlabens marinus S1-08]